MINKKAELGNQIMVLPFVVILSVIALGIWGGVSLYFSSEYDFRASDALLLNNALQKCLSQNPINWDSPLENLTSDIYSICKINQNVVEKSFVLQLELNGQEKLRLRDPLTCKLSNKNENYPKCSESYITTTFNGQNNYIHILTGSNQKSTSL